MSFTKRLLQGIDAFTRGFGKCLSWLLLLMMVASCLVVILRYGFGIGIIALQESVTYLHGTVFMLGAAYTLQQNEHVRVDIFYRNYSERKKAWIDALGILIFLLPFCALIFLSSLGFVGNSWGMRETSGEPGGIPAVFLLKSLVPLMAVLLAIQGIAELLRNTLIICEGHNND